MIYGEVANEKCDPGFLETVITWATEVARPMNRVDNRFLLGVYLGP